MFFFVMVEDWMGIISFGDVGMMRIIVWDIDIGVDFIGMEVCQMIIIGFLNFGLLVVISNGVFIVLQV